MMSTVASQMPVVRRDGQQDDMDKRIQQRAKSALEAHPHFHGRGRTICIECRGNTVILSGCLPSYYLKQLLQEVVRRVDGVDTIDNRVHVHWP